MKQASSIGILILAAGASSRLGQPKQLVHWSGGSLISKSVKAALNAGVPVVGVVGGAYFDKIKAEVKDEPVQLYYNADWQKGIGHSLKTGLEKLLYDAPNLSGVLFMVCDQPHINSDHLASLITAFQNESSIVASKYDNGITGVPVLFGRQYLKELFTLPDDKGAKPLLYKYTDLVHTIPFPGGEIDVDREDDLPF